MGFLQQLSGDDAADAANKAAADTFAKQRGAIDRLMGFGDQYAGEFRELSNAYAPYAQTGQGANTALQRLIADPSSVSSLPGYQFAQQQGMQAIDRGAAARGMLQSGRNMKDLMRFGTGLADQTYGSQLQRLMGLTQQGMQATGAQVGTVGQGLQGQLGTRQSAYGGDMTAAGTIGQGMVAGANAQAAGAQNLLNTGVKAGGMILGAATGNPFMAAGGGSTFTGNGSQASMGGGYGGDNNYLNRLMSGWR